MCACVRAFCGVFQREQSQSLVSLEVDRGHVYTHAYRHVHQHVHKHVHDMCLHDTGHKTCLRPRGQGNPLATCATTPYLLGLYSYGQYSYGLYSYGPFSYGLYSNGLFQ